ncbi:hypothetical protein ACH5RR_036203 [Cinchona calisaya]|uniref:RNase H type-1 domain-containing protein n=1 Tax=Cinchona calisaya TaxID=153742 RepID=A0ABD2Y788_9GENT
MLIQPNPLRGLGLPAIEIELVNTSHFMNLVLKLWTYLHLLWVQTLKYKYFPHTDICSATKSTHHSPYWKALIKACDILKSKLRWHVGTGSSMLIWGSGVFCDTTGMWILSYSRRIGQTSVIAAELWAVCDGLLFAWDKGFRHLELSVNAYNILQLLTDTDPRHLPLYFLSYWTAGYFSADHGPFELSMCTMN